MVLAQVVPEIQSKMYVNVSSWLRVRALAPGRARVTMTRPFFAISLEPLELEQREAPLWKANATRIMKNANVFAGMAILTPTNPKKRGYGTDEMVVG